MFGVQVLVWYTGTFMFLKIGFKRRSCSIYCLGIGSGKAGIEQCVELASRPQIATQWRKCKHLIIDEVSMVDGEYFQKLDTVAR